MGLRKPRMPNFACTDHALVRYMQRVKGIDVEAFREEALAEIGGPPAPGKYIIKKGNMEYRCDGGRIITVVEPASPTGLTRRKLHERREPPRDNNWRRLADSLEMEMTDE